MGIKALAIYRDNCKVGQPSPMAKAAKESETTTAAAEISEAGSTARLQAPAQEAPEPDGLLLVGGAEGYMTAGSYPDDGLGEVFLRW